MFRTCAGSRGVMHRADRDAPGKLQAASPKRGPSTHHPTALETCMYMDTRLMSSERAFPPLLPPWRVGRDGTRAPDHQSGLLELWITDGGKTCFWRAARSMKSMWSDPEFQGGFHGGTGLAG
jgi:hypothetical protein